MSSRSKSPFYRVHDLVLEGDGVAFEAEFAMPDDGTPDTFNRLVVRIILESPNASNAEVCVFSRTGYGTGEDGRQSKKDKPIGEFNCKVEQLADLLYGFARIKVVNVLEIR